MHRRSIFGISFNSPTTAASTCSQWAATPQSTGIRRRQRRIGKKAKVSRQTYPPTNVEAIAPPIKMSSTESEIEGPAASVNRCRWLNERWLRRRLAGWLAGCCGD